MVFSMLAALLLLATHPSIFFGSSDVTTLRQAAQTTHSEIASHITAVLNQHLNDPFSVTRSRSGPSAIR